MYAMQNDVLTVRRRGKFRGGALAVVYSIESDTDCRGEDSLRCRFSEEKGELLERARGGDTEQRRGR